MAARWSQVRISCGCLVVLQIEAFGYTRTLSRTLKFVHNSIIIQEHPKQVPLQGVRDAQELERVPPRILVLTVRHVMIDR